MWNRPAEADVELDDVYARRAPSIASTTVVSNPAQRGAETRAAEGIEACGLYGPIVADEVPWERGYSTEQWLELISTHSDHRLLDPTSREGLLGDVRRIIDRRGGTHHVRYVTRLVAAQVTGLGRSADLDR